MSSTLSDGRTVSVTGTTLPAWSAIPALTDVSGVGTYTTTVDVGKAWTAPMSHDSVTIAFKQHIGAGDALRTGAYSRTLTFTLSTTTPDDDAGRDPS
ncbi:hypothetical protein [Solirubrobacter soli]|uniref:hypothetical protein n=1 Tax=Solirubrobacter soli TaxID=363832 RepID=UPI0004023276|nr:hypothetical protein [Solirubrobacter soli]